MGNLTAQEFVRKNIRSDDIKDKSIIEVGSLIVNFSVRLLFESFSPTSYKGIDIAAGPGVDQICNAEDLLIDFGTENFDILISMEVLEHVKDWQRVISNFKNILRPGGKIFIGTRSRGFDYHGYPYDFWRYELDDMRKIFSDFTINFLEPDPAGHGLFLKATKPEEFKEKDLSAFRLYSVVSRRRIKSVTLLEMILVKIFFPVMLMAKSILRKIFPASFRGIIRKNILEKMP
jgi:SAM-dependent methyltransferase